MKKLNALFWVCACLLVLACEEFVDSGADFPENTVNDPLGQSVPGQTPDRDEQIEGDAPPLESSGENSVDNNTTRDAEGGQNDSDILDLSETDSEQHADSSVFVVVLGDLPPAALNSFLSYLENAGERVRVFRSLEEEREFSLEHVDGVHRARIVFRDATEHETLLHSEGFRIARELNDDGVVNILVEGKPKDDPRPYHNIGLGFGAFRLLEKLGYRFFHPLEAIRMEHAIDWTAVDAIETSPRWPYRHVSIHTKHPLEFTDMLQGLDQRSRNNEAGWRELLPEWETYLGWLLANGANQVGWSLQRTGEHDFDYSEERFGRLAEIVEIAHSFGIRVSCGLPLVQKQQRAWRLIDDENAPLDTQLEQLRTRTRLAMSAGFDLAGVSLGTSEFTATDPGPTIDWLNALYDIIEEEFGAELSSTAHITAEQELENVEGVEGAEGINFNFITRFSNENIRTSAHTVQHYALDDPAPTYGNDSFQHMRDFMREEAGKRRVHFGPEAAYWVSFDVDVPLFLPVYAERRFHDIRLIVEDEDAGLIGEGEHAGTQITGQSLFTTGWEWGYWFNEVISSRAAWAPSQDKPEREDFRDLVTYLFEPFPEGATVADWIIDLADAQHELLIHGQVGGSDNWDVVEKNAQAYLQGTETWDAISELAESIPGIPLKATQPTRLSPFELLEPRARYDVYPNRVRPLLIESENRFVQAHTNLENVLASLTHSAEVGAGWIGVLEEFRDAIEITALRAEQVRLLYEYRSDPLFQLNENLLGRAQAVLDRGLDVSARREANYRVDAERIAAWRENPTAYPFTYLWSARSLFYWWRDEGLFTHMDPNPCYMNVIDPIDIALGEESWMTAADVAALVFERIPGLGEITDCMSVDESIEPDFRAIVRDVQ